MPLTSTLTIPLLSVTAALTLLAPATPGSSIARLNRSAPATRSLEARLDTAVLAGGCFWGIQAVFQHTKGVVSATSGYAGGTTRAPSYEQVGTGSTGHAESVRIIYDPAQVPFDKILEIFFTVAHDPTQLNRQGPDAGTQYRSIAFFRSPEQKHAIDVVISKLSGAKIFRGTIVTEVAPFKAFYAAEGYHQNYATLHPEQPYIVINDAPKVVQLKKHYPDLYRDEPMLEKLTP